MKKATDIALRVFDAEISALEAVKGMLSSEGSKFQSIIDEMFACKGKVIITGMGKSGHIAKKIAASMASLGTSAFCLHPAEAMHGDLGMIQSSDLVIAISNSGESEEIVKILPNIIRIGATLVGITCNPNSTLARSSHICEVFPPFSEACLLGLAPTSSATAVLVYGDALALAASEIRNFGKNDFALFHPAGSLGKKLILRVSDCMVKYDLDSSLSEDALISTALAAMCRTSAGVVPVYGEAHNFAGTLSAQDLEAALDAGKDIYNGRITDLINRDPVFISPDELAIEALKIMMNGNGGHEYMIVLNENEAVGVIFRENIIEKGIYI